jgi:hypothetical protein
MSDWPAPVSEQALHGPAGEFVLRTEPHSEAHPMALLSQFLSARLGDPTADEIWAAAKERPGGLTRTEVSHMFSRNKKRRESERALSVLEDAGRLRRETRQPQRGRSAEFWIPVLAPAS